MIRTSFETTSLAYIGGNETSRGRPMWEIAADYNKESKQLNGNVTSVRRRNVKSIRPILG